jgi:hypothetical protein
MEASKVAGWPCANADVITLLFRRHVAATEICSCRRIAARVRAEANLMFKCLVFATQLDHGQAVTAIHRDRLQQAGLTSLRDGQTAASISTQDDKRSQRQST